MVHCASAACAEYCGSDEFPQRFPSGAFGPGLEDAPQTSYFLRTWRPELAYRHLQKRGRARMERGTWH